MTAPWRRGSAIVGGALACSLFASPCRSDELEWQPTWRRVGVPEYAVTVGAFSGYLALRFVAPKSSEARWSKPILFDAPVRSALRLNRRRARDGVETAADVLEYTLLAQSLVVDPWLVAGLARQSPDVSWQLFVISAQSHSVAMLLNATTKLLSARERPYAEACIRDPSYHQGCLEDDRYRSFYSSHSSIAATSAGLACAHHTNLSLYADSREGIAVCAGTALVALSVGAFRILADEHWATDVLAGELIGFSIGYLLPTLLYYQEDSPSVASGTSAALARERAPSPRVLTFAGAF